MFSFKTVDAATTARALILDQGANVRKGPGTQNTKITSLGKYSYYNLVEDRTYPDTNNHSGCEKDWYQLYYNGVATGYVCGEHVEVVRSYSTDDIAPNTACEKEMANAGFPSSYWGGLCRLKEKHPNWIFRADNTNSNWTDAIQGESACGWNLISNTESNAGFIDTTCNKYGDTYVGILPKGIAYYMDPRNYLSERYVFQFLHLGYDNNFSTHYPEGVSSILGGSAFYKYHINLGNNMPTLINNAGVELNVSPVFISARILQELGNKETLYNLYSGVYTGYDNLYYGYYNFYNFGVSDSCVKNYGTTYCGLNYAYKSGWNSVDAAIKGGVSQLAKNYLNKNQYTLYYQKFNVLGSGSFPKYSHQYMTNINAPSSESVTTYNTYTKLGIMDSAFIFYIPTFNNMSAAIDNSGNGAIGDNDNTTNPNTIPIYTVVTSAGYKYTSGYISGLNPNTSVSSVKSSLESISGNNTVTITNQNGATVTEGLIGTGYKVTISNSSTSEILQIVVKGDTSGDGNINALDLLQVQKKILGTYNLSGAYLLAGDTSGDGNINALDLLQVQKSILGTYTIVQ